MNRIKCFLFFFTTMMFGFFAAEVSVNAEEINYNYTGMLGYSYSTNRTVFKLYSNTATEVVVNVEGAESKQLLKNSSDNSVWETFIAGDLNGKEYSYTITDENGVVHEGILDPYGKYINKTGTKSVIYSDSVNEFEQWEQQNVFFSEKDNRKIIYGVNVEGFTTHNSWTGTEGKRGKLLGLIESDINSRLIGFDYIKSLGITYVELSEINSSKSPFSIDNKYVTGQLSSNGELEFRQVVNEFYLNNIGVVFTFDYKQFSQEFIDSLNVIGKDCYLNDEGKLDLGKQMTKEYIFELLSYYVSNYKLSGIRIENMSDYSVDFMASIIDELKIINENIIVYGLGTSSSESYVGESSIKDLKGIKLINGSLSYALLGDLNDKTEKGILSGNYEKSNIETLKHALLSGVDNGKIDYSLVKGINYKGDMKISNSYQLINYIAKGDGLSTYDKLTLDSSISKSLIQQKIIMAYGAMMTSGGIPYIYSGEEFLMSYLDVDNSGNSICNENNNFCYHTQAENKVIDWREANNNAFLVNAVKSLINYRKSSQSVAQTNVNLIKNYVDIYTDEQYPGLIGMIRSYPNAKSRDTEKVVAMLNFSNNDYTIHLEGDGWYGLYAYNNSIRDGENLVLKANSIYTEYKEKQPKVNQWVTLILVVGLITTIYSVNVFLNKKLVEKKGYDIGEVKKKYRWFIKKENLPENTDRKETIIDNKTEKDDN